MPGGTNVRRATLFALVVCFGCGGDDSAGTDSGIDTDDVVNPMDDPFPGANCATDGGTSTGSCVDTTTTPGDSHVDDCSSSEDCDGGVCAAIPTSNPNDDGRLSRGSFICEAICIGNLDEGRWCSDDASCCDSNARCTTRGYCVAEGSSDATTGNGSTGGSSTGDGSTGGGSTGGTGDTDTDGTTGG